MIRLSEVAVVRGANRVVDSLTVEIAPGRIFWLVGANGSGKSSLLRVMAGLDLPRRGTVERWFPPDRRLLYFGSEMTLPLSASVRDWERLVDRLAAHSGWNGRTALWPRVAGARRVAELSTGERKRLLLDAFLRQPGPAVLDEPFGYLSPDAVAELRTLLELRSRHHVVIVATNQGVHRARRDGGLRLEAGSARPLDGDRRWPDEGGRR